MSGDLDAEIVSLRIGGLDEIAERLGCTVARVYAALSESARRVSAAGFVEEQRRESAATGVDLPGGG